MNKNIKTPFEKLQRVSEKRLNEEDEKQVKDLYNKIKELKEEIEFTKDNKLIIDEKKKALYINELEVEINKCYTELRFIEKMLNILDEKKDSVDDYLDNWADVRGLEFYNK